MLQISLTEQDAVMLREILDAKLLDLRHEVSHTDSREFRVTLHQVEAMLERLLAQLKGSMSDR
ncbi:MAG TPA: hypothetical protein VGQ10_10140 [Vicinamibacterales bacterium]|nr:hypothetical protein [Vicinamibacterales bacterium]